MFAIVYVVMENEYMADSSNEHLSAVQVEQAALSEITLHALQCERCAGAIIQFSQTLKTVPLEQYPATQ